MRKIAWIRMGLLAVIDIIMAQGIWTTKEAGIGISLAIILIAANLITIKISIGEK